MRDGWKTAGWVLLALAAIGVVHSQRQRQAEYRAARERLEALQQQAAEIRTQSEARESEFRERQQKAQAEIDRLQQEITALEKAEGAGPKLPPAKRRDTP